VPKKTRGNSVDVVISLHLGELDSLRNKGAEPSLAGAMLMRGSSKHTRQQIADELNQLKAQMNVFGGISGARVTIRTTRPNVEQVMRLAAEVLREPAFPP